MSQTAIHEDAAAVLMEAKKAWKKLVNAQVEKSRLERYRSMTPGMRKDYGEATAAISEAREQLTKLLGK